MADVITDTGRQHIAGLLAKTITSPANYFGNVGSLVATALVTDTTLGTEVATARITTVTSIQTTGSPTNNTARNTFTYTATANQNVTNAGIATTVTSGAATVIQKSDFTLIPLQNTDSIAFTFDDRIL